MGARGQLATAEASMQLRITQESDDMKVAMRLFGALFFLVGMA